MSNLLAEVYRTDLLYSSAGLNDTDVTSVATVVSSAWNPSGDPINVYAAVYAKLSQAFTVTGSVTHPMKYFQRPKNGGGVLRVCMPERTINVALNGHTVAVDLHWDDEQT